MSTRSRRGLATWLTTSTSPIFVLDARRMVLVFNRGCEELTQCPAEEIIGKSCHAQTIADPAHPAHITGILSPPDDGTTPSVSRVVVHRRDGTVLEKEIHFFPLLTEDDGETGHILGLIVDLQTGAPAPISRRFDIARHTADLYLKYRLDRLVAKSPAMQRVASQIDLARQSLTTVHLIGASGTGKEHVARLIHYGSPNRQQRFIPIRCAESSVHEIERTLHRLYDPDRGQEPATLYLDQVQQLPQLLQRLVADQLALGHFRHLSSSQTGIDSLNDEQFLPELRWRLAALSVSLPRLSERGEDLLLLAQQILEEQNQTGGIQRQGFSPLAERAFLQYNWPGNVDELSRVIVQAVQRTPSPIIDILHLPPDFAAGMTAQQIRPRPVRLSLEYELDAFERQRIEEALNEARGNKSLAADLLQMPRAKLYRRLAHLGFVQEEDNTPLDPT